MNMPAGDEPAPQSRAFSSVIATALAAALILGAAAWALELQQYMAWSLYPQQFFARLWAWALALVFLTLPARRGSSRERIPWYDFVAAALGFLAAAGSRCIIRPCQRDLRPPGCGLYSRRIIVLLVLEALRRTVGWALIIVVLVFLVYALLGNTCRVARRRAQDWRSSPPIWPGTARHARPADGGGDDHRHRLRVLRQPAVRFRRLRFFTDSR